MLSAPMWEEREPICAASTVRAQLLSLVCTAPTAELCEGIQNAAAHPSDSSAIPGSRRPGTPGAGQSGCGSGVWWLWSLVGPVMCPVPEEPRPRAGLTAGVLLFPTNREMLWAGGALLMGTWPSCLKGLADRPCTAWGSQSRVSRAALSGMANVFLRACRGKALGLAIPSHLPVPQL